MAIKMFKSWLPFSLHSLSLVNVAIDIKAPLRKLLRLQFTRCVILHYEEGWDGKNNHKEQLPLQINIDIRKVKITTDNKHSLEKSASTMVWKCDPNCTCIQTPKR